MHHATICRPAVRLLALTLAAVTAAGSTGCASIVSGGNERPVDIDTDPPGAAITVNGERYGTTPQKILLDRGEDHLVTLRKSGFEPFEFEVEPELNGWVFGNIIFGGFIGLGVDALTGAWQAPSPGKVRVRLLPEGQDYPAQSVAIRSMNKRDRGERAERADRKVAARP